jgi:Uma2 family endonuclease
MTTLAPRRTFTPDDLLRLRDSPKRYELVDGRLEVLGVSYLSSFVAGRLYKLLSIHVESHNLGWVAPEGTSLQCFSQYPDRVRKPDVCFHKLERLPHDLAVSEGHLSVVPDLVVEVISPRDRAIRVNTKLNEWIGAGVPLIWLVYPEDRQVRAFYSGGSVQTYNVADTLTGDPVLPGFAVPVAELFRLPA